MTPISKNIFIDKLHDIFNNVTVNIIAQLKMRPVDVKSNTYIDSSKEINDKDPKFKIGDIVGISKYKNIFAKAMFQIGLKKVL